MGRPVRPTQHGGDEVGTVCGSGWVARSVRLKHGGDEVGTEVSGPTRKAHNSSSFVGVCAAVRETSQAKFCGLQLLLCNFPGASWHKHCPLINGTRSTMKGLAEREAVSLLSSAQLGRLGCVFNGEPYVVPVNYFFEDGSIYSHSLPGRKIDALRAHPRACLQVDSIQDDFHWRSVIAYGDFEEISSPGERKAILSKLLARFPLLTPVESTIAHDAHAPDSVVFRIRIDQITGAVEG